MTLTRQQVTRTVTLLSLLFFVGSTGFAFIGLFKGEATPTSQASDGAPSQTQQLKLQEEGYLAVLKREPKNQTALQGLVDVRLASNNIKGAIAPLETLAALNPGDSNLKALLEQMKTNVAIK